MTDNTIRCDRLDELLPEYLEGTLDAGTRANVELHLAGCQRCASLIADLNAITEAANNLPDLSPSKDLWSGISDRIAAPVISLPSERERHATRYQRLRMVGAAAALVIMTATLTFVGTKYFMGVETQPTQVASDPVRVPVPGATDFGPDSIKSAEPTRSTTPIVEPPTGPRPTSAPATQQQRPARTAIAANVGRTSAERAYDREINQLQALLRERRGELDPKTVQVIERNLNVIDEAIRQSREALQGDPASRFLNDQLNNALGRKVELLRSAAMLPSSI
ncbi:MAG TPA: zf-HC2 domain-containing protein [Gemmatimonadaceae bacterium]|nr:zf-HC2 domain-containing protein [Gemmatimonadaceae bacterium]